MTRKFEDQKKQSQYNDCLQRFLRYKRASAKRKLKPLDDFDLFLKEFGGIDNYVHFPHEIFQIAKADATEIVASEIF